MSSYAMVEPFGIDDGSLADISPEQAFTLGVEWEMIRHGLGAPVILRTVHTSNQRRIDALLARNGYFRRWYLHDDWCDVLAALSEEDLESAEDDH